MQGEASSRVGLTGYFRVELAWARLPARRSARRPRRDLAQRSARVAPARGGGGSDLREQILSLDAQPGRPFALYQRVVLTQDLPKEELRAGDVAVIVEHSPPRAEIRRRPVLAGPTRDQALGLSIPCMVSQLTKALNQPVLVVSLGYMPKP